MSIESNLSDSTQKPATQQLVDAFNNQGKTQASLNTIDAETFRTQLPTLLTSGTPPDVYGSALRALSTDQHGRQIFVPVSYYWWGMFYRKSNFARWDVTELVGVYDTLTALIVVQVGFGLGFYPFVLQGFMRAIPDEIQQAAVIDGATPRQIFLRIILPLTRPALAALAFTWCSTTCSGRSRSSAPTPTCRSPRP